MGGGRYGFEASTDWRPQDWWRLTSAYSYLRMREPAEAITPLDRFSEGQNPTHQVSVRSAVDLPRSVELDAWVRHVAALPSIG
jgi:iron complex outermembrane receptor protein